MAEALGALLGTPGEVHAPGGRPLRRLGLALEPDPGLAAWCRAEQLDALVLHRSRDVDPSPGLAVVGCHDPFDARLGLAGNPWLHRRLGLTEARPLVPKAVVALAPPGLAARVGAVFGGVERREGTPAATGRAVLADAMSADRIEAAAAAGAGLYVTGTWRPSAAAAVHRTGLAVLAVGHARQERWSLGLLADLLAAGLPGVAVRVRDAARPEPPQPPPPRADL